MTSFTRSGRCVVCLTPVIDHYAGQRFIACAQLRDERGDFRLQPPDQAPGYPEVTDQALQRVRHRIAAALNHGAVR